MNWDEHVKQQENKRVDFIDKESFSTAMRVKKLEERVTALEALLSKYIDDQPEAKS